jgi:hypothetical protein
MTTRDEARRTAMAYAWGCEDTSSTKTAYRPELGQVSGDWAFGEAYAQGQDDYNSERRGDMTSVQAAYGNWQASGGRSVFKRGSLTLGDEQRAELRASWPYPDARPGAYEGYWRLQDRMQDEAWALL